MSYKAKLMRVAEVILHHYPTAEPFRLLIRQMLTEISEAEAEKVVRKLREALK